MNDLFEFLMTRIEEDEDVYRGIVRVAVVARPAALTQEAHARGRRWIALDHNQWDGDGKCHTCRGAGNRRIGYPCPTLRAIAQGYSEHRDYRPEWGLPGWYGFDDMVD